MSGESKQDLVVDPNISEKKKRKKKAARVQVDPSVLDEDDKPQQTGNIFNIWYYNWGSKENYQKKSPFRVNVKQDSGYTKADKIPNSFVCLFFARGCCHKGKHCDYLHRIPNQTKDAFPATTDCFGRDKFSNYRDDMGGVGNFLRPNRTIYVGKLPLDAIPRDSSIEQVISEQFGEFGRIERFRVIHEKNCAFVTFENEWNAQFAKEAMAHQSLVKDEVLNLRWANEDPNPQAKARNQRQLQEQAMNTIKNLLNQNEQRPQTMPKRKTISENRNTPKKLNDGESINSKQISKKRQNTFGDDAAKPEEKKLKSTKHVESSGFLIGYGSDSDSDDDDD
ncbi:Cwc2 protein [Saccharomycopsis crataegensis]|uniref:Pre-mRNA-splicing factor CWC2 n=1 Tax=Saccharomycopsis crataegensis TaxID=43959 RepID=A0AAV5QK02_9ASCO|nr:Cwc2 protein [Saccharomycopsis crataegensis]